MNFENFKCEVLLSLGGGMIDVELGDEEIALAFNKAKRTFIQKGHNTYRRDFFRLNVNTCQNSYKLSTDVNTVVKIIKPGDTYFSINDEFSLAAYNDLFGWKADSQMGDYLSYDLTLQLLETWRRYLAYEVQWHYNPLTGDLSFLKPPERNEIWLIELYRNLTDDQYRDILWIQSWAIAEAKIMLGMAYRKFPQLPGPDGSISLDGNSLIQDGEREKEQLIEDINNLIDGAPDYYEITFG